MEIMKILKAQWDRTLAAVAALVGALALLLGYIGISDTPHVADQLPYILSGGLVGIFALGIAAIAWVSADMRDEWRELRALRNLLDEDIRRRDRGDSDSSSHVSLTQVRRERDDEAGASLFEESHTEEIELPASTRITAPRARSNGRPPARVSSTATTRTPRKTPTRVRAAEQ